MTVTISVLNKSKTPLGVDIDQMIHASQVFLHKCFVPVWGYGATLVRKEKARKGSWQIVLLDDADEADALGYHDLTQERQPISKVFVKTTIDDGQKVSVTFCHELCEMLIDPLCNLWALNEKDGKMYAYEMCDAVEDYEFDVEGVAMSDFVHPGFFETTGHGKLDWLDKVSKPFQTTKGGYQIVMENGNIGQVYGSNEKRKRFAKEDRRLHRSEYRGA
jgi:hypothetical protein